ncbi:hypothetical protein [Limnoraphis robusta]|uniref:Uncharacterized protein n=1 Tax=Limnoraphis robusta CCNP1315 TaxID=3110306 RepID=A0ABU5TZV2_9CYAN|nr:hypothetical protein [Limnoraphis robusta]MEA5519948.1 hypothetical protein [Limnoraphis robusta CCNP1315]MEA5544946.1 hypothetical protein [Limnoraphis robusta CCNP1324]
MSEKDLEAKLIEKVTNDPMLLRKLCDRVDELMKEDLRNQRDRTCNSRRLL